MLKQIIIMLMLISTQFTNLVVSLDEELIIPQGHDDELISDYLGDEELIFIGGISFIYPNSNVFEIYRQGGGYSPFYMVSTFI